MPSVFTKIIAGELPGRFVWRDDEVVAFLTIAPFRPGHTLVVPRREVDQWTDIGGPLLARCVTVAQAVGQAAKQVWSPPRIGLVIAGFEVDHLHLHVFPAWEIGDVDFARADPNPRPEDLDGAAELLRSALRDLGHGAHVPD